MMFRIIVIFRKLKPYDDKNHTEETFILFLIIAYCSLHVVELLFAFLGM